jgi:hypothetical protein
MTFELEGRALRSTGARLYPNVMQYHRCDYQVRVDSLLGVEVFTDDDGKSFIDVHNKTEGSADLYLVGDRRHRRVNSLRQNGNARVYWNEPSDDWSRNFDLPQDVRSQLYGTYWTQSSSDPSVFPKDLHESAVLGVVHNALDMPALRSLRQNHLSAPVYGSGESSIDRLREFYETDEAPGLGTRHPMYLVALLRERLFPVQDEHTPGKAITVVVLELPEDAAP